jgi:hypothetical protein
MTGDEERWVTVRVLGLPLDLHVRSAEHSADLQREFVLIHEGMQATGEPPSVPHRFVELVDMLSARYADVGREQEDELEAAVAAGERTIDLTFYVPSHTAEACVQLGAVLDEADEYCRQGQHLLTLATPPELVEYRRWYLDEFVRQIAGHPPRRWPPTG